MTRFRFTDIAPAVYFGLIYLVLAWLTTMQMQSGTWLIWASVVSFTLVSHLVWGEFRPGNAEQVRDSQPISGFRFLSGLSGGFNFFLFGHLIWFWGDANPIIWGQESTFYFLFAGMCLMYPLTIWGASWGLESKVSPSGQ
jgi:hypothetical protein